MTGLVSDQASSRVESGRCETGEPFLRYMAHLKAYVQNPDERFPSKSMHQPCSMIVWFMVSARPFCSGV